MKILFCKNSFAGPISGADEVAVTYATELKRAGHATSVLLVQAPLESDFLVARLRAADIPFDTLASPVFSASLATVRRFAIRAMRTFSPATNLIRSSSRKVVFNLLQHYQDACCEYLKQTKPDVMHVLTPDPGAVMLIRAAQQSNIPVVYQEVGIPFHPPGFEEGYQRFVSVLPLCADVAVLSPILAREFLRVVPQVETAHVLPLITQDHNGARPRNTASGRVTFGFAARFEYLKGPLQLVDAFRIAHQTHPEIEVKFAGDGSQRKEILDASRRLGVAGKCNLDGVYKTLNERSQFMHGIDVFVLPSLTEGTPNTIIEAMSHAKPVIATAVGGVPDVVTDEVGILVPPNNVEALARAMCRLAADANLRRVMGLAARKRYEQFFAPPVVLPLLVDFYESVILKHAINNGEEPIHSQRQAKFVHPWSNGTH